MLNIEGCSHIYEDVDSMCPHTSLTAVITKALGGLFIIKFMKEFGSFLISHSRCQI